MAACRTVLPFLDGDLLAVDGQRHGVHNHGDHIRSRRRGDQRRGNHASAESAAADAAFARQAGLAGRISGCLGGLDTAVPAGRSVSRTRPPLPGGCHASHARPSPPRPCCRMGRGRSSSSLAPSASPRSSSGSSRPRLARTAASRAWRRPPRCPAAVPDTRRVGAQPDAARRAADSRRRHPRARGPDCALARSQPDDRSSIEARSASG